MLDVKLKEYPLPDDIIQFHIDVPTDPITGKQYPRDSFEFQLIQHYANGVKMPDMTPFLETRKTFQEHGTYTPNLRYNPHPASEYAKFWIDEEQKCLNGCTKTINGKEIFVPGYLYWYWNFTPIHRSKETGRISKTGKKEAIRVYDFPDVYDIDYYWFLYLEEARHRAQHAACLKKRGIGFSFKAASMLTRNFYLMPKSKGYAVADSWDYLTEKDGLLVKVSEQLSFIDEHTEFRKKRHYKDTDKYRRASFKEKTADGALIERGYMSEMIGISLEGKPDKMRGLRGNLIIYEESGNNKELQRAWEISRSSVEQGDEVYGMLIAFGTGGTVGEGFDAIDKMIHNPESFNIYGIPNFWEKGRIQNKIAFFIPDYVCRTGNMIDGNSDILSAIQVELGERETKKGNPILLRQRMAEHPFTIQDAIMRVEGSPFDISLIREQIAEIEVNPLYKNARPRYGEMIIKGDGSADFKETVGARPLLEFPTIDREPDGCIVIYEMPVKDQNGKMVRDAYVAGTDPVDLNRDDVGDKFSLASTFIINRFTRRIVAEYTGRPRFKDTYYEQLRRLLIFYNNCQTLFEANLVGIFDHFNKMNSVYLFANTPALFRDMFTVKGISNNIGIKSDSRGQVKAHGRDLINKWSLEILESLGYSYDSEENEQARTKYMMHTIRSKPLLQEMKDWTKDGNFDRVDGLTYALIHLEEKSTNLTSKESMQQSILSDPYWDKIISNGRKKQIKRDERGNLVYD